MGTFNDYEERIKLSRTLIGLHVLKVKGHLTMEYDFDYLKNLYTENPDEFDKFTSKIIDDFINSLDEDKREIYRAKQWRLEQELGKIKNPLERMNRMVAIFWEGVNEGVAEMRKLGFGKDATITPIVDPEPQKPAEVLDFKKKSD